MMIRRRFCRNEKINDHWNLSKISRESGFMRKMIKLGLRKFCLKNPLFVKNEKCKNFLRPNSYFYDSETGIQFYLMSEKSEESSKSSTKKILPKEYFLVITKEKFDQQEILNKIFYKSTEVQNTLQISSKIFSKNLAKSINLFFGSHGEARYLFSPKIKLKEALEVVEQKVKSFESIGVKIVLEEEEKKEEEKSNDGASCYNFKLHEEVKEVKEEIKVFKDARNGHLETRGSEGEIECTNFAEKKNSNRENSYRENFYRDDDQKFDEFYRGNLENFRNVYGGMDEEENFDMGNDNFKILHRKNENFGNSYIENIDFEENLGKRSYSSLSNNEGENISVDNLSTFMEESGSEFELLGKKYF